MSTDNKTRVVTTYRLQEMKSRGEKIAMLTAYDYSMARIVDSAGVDVVLVGDSAGAAGGEQETLLAVQLRLRKSDGGRGISSKKRSHEKLRLLPQAGTA